ncbi:neurotrypsin-like isoform X1 [Mya arenaria]|uniref:neurotrypsin-like isoform X1 n=1 Tax=Mya arenaria TaxID=6604 RepID=UPI0022E902A4|nr:neurotrypsin-like isoform X1 [Mya arenaria]
MMRCYLSLLWMFSVFLLVEGLIIEDFRLSWKRVPSEGLLEAKVNGTWGAVRYISRYNWRDPLDDLVCRTFGYVNESVMQPQFNGTPDAAFTIQHCPVEVASMQMLNTSCELQAGNPQSDYDNIFKSINCRALQLVDGPSPLEGRLEAGLFGQLQAVYGRTFDEKAANVTCTSLGYPGVRSYNTSTHYGAGKLPLYTRNIQCTGTELSLEQCTHSGDYTAPSTSAEVVSVACDGGPLKLEQSKGNRSYEGILVGYHDNIWYDVVGQVSETTAKTMCSILGFGHVGFATRAHPGKNLHYYKQNIVCQGHEKYIEECQGELKYCVEQRYYHCTIMSNSLTHVALFCSDYTLENISLSATGVIQVGVNGQIWAVCDAYFTPETANSVCTVLGFHGTESFDVKTTGDNSVIEILGSIICKPNATSVIDCHIKHQFSYRPYDSSAECRNYVLLTCN